MASFWEINSTCLTVSCSTSSSRSLVFLAKRLMDSTTTVSPFLTQSDEEAFWKKFANIYGEKTLADKPLFDEFYATDFHAAKGYCGFNPNAAIAVHTVKEMGLRTALATNPIFPAAATESRIRWAGLEPEDFELYTTYENIGFCKPNPDYYREIAKRLGVQPEKCLMVGNDVTEDMVAEKAGMQVFLLTDCLINKERKNISVYPRGSFLQLLDHIGNLLGHA